MDWEAIGAIGEIAGAMGVIATLAYLAIQIRTNMGWQQRQGFRDAVSNLKDAIARICPNAKLYNSGCANYHGLSEDYQLHFRALMTEKYAAFELFYDFHSSGDVKIDSVAGINRWMKSDFTKQGVRDWWEDIGRETFSYDFGEIVDLLVAEIIGTDETAGGNQSSHKIRAGI